MKRGPLAIAVCVLACGSSVGAPPTMKGESAGDAGAALSGAAGAGGDSAPCRAISKDAAAWPGRENVMTLEAETIFESDVSGITYESPGVLWAVNNLSATLLRLVKRDAGYELDPTNGWAAGKRLRFPDGERIPDAEGVSIAATSASGIYVSSERDLNAGESSRLSILRYDASAPATTLTATHEWDVTSQLPGVAPNAGLESITWVSDAWLTAHGFLDESGPKPYEPEDYGEHGGGMFLVGVEQTGMVYGFALDHTNGSATLLTSLSTPLTGVMGLEMDRDSGELWAYCDDTCDNQAVVLQLAASGRFELSGRYRAPAGLPPSNHEGIALAPDRECSEGFKPFFWTDDADAAGVSLRQGALTCCAQGG